MSAPATPAPTRGLLVPTVFTVVALAILLALGTWQVERLQWKEALLARIDSRIHGAAEPLPPRTAWASLDPVAEEYRRVTAQGTWDSGQALIFRGAGKAEGDPMVQPGYWVMGALHLDGGGSVLVNRGFVSLDRKDTPALAPPAGRVTVTGLLRSPEDRNIFTPRDNPAAGQWYTRDPQAIAVALGLADAAPFSIDEEAHPAPPGSPAGGATVIEVPNNHLSYAITWYGLALTLVGVYAALVLKRRRG